LKTVEERIKELEKSVEKLAAETKTADAAYKKTVQMLNDVKERIAEHRRNLADAEQLREELLKQIDEKEQNMERLSEERKKLERALREAREQDELHEVKILIHRMVSFSFSSVAFMLVAVPLGVLARHGHFIVGLGLGILLVMAYYAVFFTGYVFADWRYIPVPVGLWSANVVLSLLGCTLLYVIFRR